MKRLILHLTTLCAALAIGGATAHAQMATDAAGRSPWGANDEIGTLNMMTDQSRLEILGRINSGKIYDLSVDLFVGMPTCCADAFGDPTYQIWKTHEPTRREGGNLVSHSSDTILMNTHTGTHIDSLNHFGIHGRIWNEVSASEALSDRGWTKSGADKIPPIAARGVLIDVAASKGVQHLPASYAITAADLKKALDRQGSKLRPGDVVLIRTGLMTVWPDKSKYQLFNQSGLSLEAARWLVEEQKAMLLGADNFGLESFPSSNPENFAPVHTYLLAEKGVPFIEVMWLEDLARDKMYEFLFVAAPVKLRGATGSPMRPLAIPIAPRG
ncbi:MAG TPA: cyclase family protein [Xanthobacteraceae bacterium]|nr:cyclase family protein [Xanthobacteraceae bacterium]